MVGDGDPFKVLGVSPDVSALELKRAYAKLVKQNRPEVAPERFQEIQAAYEDARALLAAHEERSLGNPEFPVGSREASYPQDDEYAQAATAMEGGDLAAATALAGRGRASEPEAAWPYVILFEAARREGRDAPESHLLQGLIVGAQLAEYILRTCTDDELEALSSDDRCTWDTLSNQTHEQARFELYSARIDNLVARGHISLVECELEIHVGGSERSRAPAPFIWRMVSVVAWTNPRLAADAMFRFPAMPGEWSTDFLAAEHATLLAPDVALRVVPRLAPMVLTLLRVSRFSFEAHRQVLPDLAEAISRPRSSTADSIRILAKEAPQLAEHIIESVDLTYGLDPRTAGEFDDESTATVAKAARKLTSSTALQGIALLSPLEQFNERGINEHALVVVPLLATCAYSLIKGDAVLTSAVFLLTMFLASQRRLRGLLLSTVDASLVRFARESTFSLAHLCEQTLALPADTKRSLVLESLESNLEAQLVDALKRAGAAHREIAARPKHSVEAST